MERIGSHVRPYEAVNFEMQQRKACRALWEAVLCQALKDCSGRPTFDWDATGAPLKRIIRASKQEREALFESAKDRLVSEAMDWVNSDDEGPGSCAWICNLLECDHEQVKHAAQKINESGFKNHVAKTGLGAVMWHVEQANLRQPSVANGKVEGRAGRVRLYEEVLEDD